jgi:hypothetical protein
MINAKIRNKYSKLSMLQNLTQKNRGCAGETPLFEKRVFLSS